MPNLAELPFQAAAKIQQYAERGWAELHYARKMFEAGALKLEEEAAEVTGADVDEAVERLRQQAATFEVVEGRTAQDDDYAMVNYRGQDIQDSKAEPVIAAQPT